MVTVCEWLTRCCSTVNQFVKSTKVQTTCRFLRLAFQYCMQAFLPPLTSLMFLFLAVSVDKSDSPQLHCQMTHSFTQLEKISDRTQQRSHVVIRTWESDGAIPLRNSYDSYKQTSKGSARLCYSQLDEGQQRRYIHSIIKFSSCYFTG